MIFLKIELCCRIEGAVNCYRRDGPVYASDILCRKQTYCEDGGRAMHKAFFSKGRKMEERVGVLALE